MTLLRHRSFLGGVLFKTGFLCVVRHRDLPASATQLLGLKMSAPTHAYDVDVYYCRNNVCIARKIAISLDVGLGTA